MGCPLGGLEGVYLPGFFLDGSLEVGSHIAVPYTPFGFGLGKDGAILTGGKFFDLLAVSTLLNDCVTAAAIKLTAFLAHEKAIRPLFYACTNHFNHILSQ